MNDQSLLQQIEALLHIERARIVSHLAALITSAKEETMSTLDDAIAAAAAQVATLNTKVDAALAALAASVASQTPVTQAELDAIGAIGTAASGEAAKVDAALTPAAAPAPAAAEAPSAPVDGPTPTA